jgi:hypothetical protein
LKRLIVSGTDDPLWTSSINPVDRPPSTPEAIDIEAAVTRALRERTDLQQSQNNLKISDINLRNQVDLTRPQLNLAATYGLAGLGGPFLGRTGDVDPITGGPVSSVIPSGYFDAEHHWIRCAAMDGRRQLRVPARQKRAGSERGPIEAVARPDAGESQSA